MAVDVLNGYKNKNAPHAYLLLVSDSGIPVLTISANASSPPLSFACIGLLSSIHRNCADADKPLELQQLTSHNVQVHFSTTFMAHTVIFATNAFELNIASAHFMTVYMQSLCDLLKFYLGSSLLSTSSI